MPADLVLFILLYVVVWYVMKRKLYLNTVTSLLMQVTTIICGFILPRLLLDNFGSEVNGLTQSITQFLGIITFMELGVGQVIQSALYKPLSQGNVEWTSRIIKSGTRYFRKIAYGLLLYVLILLVAFPYITGYQFDWLYTAVLILAISVDAFSRFYFGMIDKILLSADQKGYVQYIAQILTVLLNTIVVVLVIRGGSSIQFVKICSAAVFLLNPLVIRWYIHRHYQIDRHIRYQGEPIQQKWNGIAQHVSAVILEGTDNIVLTLFATLSDVSVYSVYFMVISGIRQLYVSITGGIQSMVGALWAKKEIVKLEQFFYGIEVALHFAVVFLFSCIAVLIVPFVRVYTNGLTDADYTQPLFAAILTLAYGIRCLRTPYNILILAGGHYKQTQSCHILAAILNIVISVVAVIYWGLIGIAIGTLVAFSYQTIWMALYNSRELLKLNILRIIKQFLVDILTALAILLATSGFKLYTVSYMGWIRMAVPVALIAFCITVIAALLFYRQPLKSLLHYKK